MPNQVQGVVAHQTSDYLKCIVCLKEFSASRPPVSLACNHTICKLCIAQMNLSQCPFDRASGELRMDQLPINRALLQLVKVDSEQDKISALEVAHLQMNTGLSGEMMCDYLHLCQLVEDIILYLKPFKPGSAPPWHWDVRLSRTMHRKLITLAQCQPLEEKGRRRLLKACRAIGERVTIELIIHNQDPQQQTVQLWNMVRSRGCQFLGPATQEEILRLTLTALDAGAELSRRTLVGFIMQRMKDISPLPLISKTSIGHVIQILYRASCFDVSRVDVLPNKSSLMSLKPEFRTYESLRRQHDAQLVQLGNEAGVRFSPEQWSHILYGDGDHKSHMQSIIDCLQTDFSFKNAINELYLSLLRSEYPNSLMNIKPHLYRLAEIGCNMRSELLTFRHLATILESTLFCVKNLTEFIGVHRARQMPREATSFKYKFKTSMCHFVNCAKVCPNGEKCPFAHNWEEMKRYRGIQEEYLKNDGNLIDYPTEIIGDPEYGSTWSVVWSAGYKAMSQYSPGQKRSDFRGRRKNTGRKQKADARSKLANLKIGEDGDASDDGDSVDSFGSDKYNSDDDASSDDSCNWEFVDDSDGKCKKNVATRRRMVGKTASTLCFKNTLVKAEGGLGNSEVGKSWSLRHTKYSTNMANLFKRGITVREFLDYTFTVSKGAPADLTAHKGNEYFYLDDEGFVPGKVREYDYGVKPPKNDNPRAVTELFCEWPTERSDSEAENE